MIALTLLRIGVLRLDHRDSLPRGSSHWREALRSARGELPEFDVIIGGDETRARAAILDHPEICAPWLELDSARLALGVVDDLRDDETVLALEVLLEVKVPGVRVCRDCYPRRIRMTGLIGRTTGIGGYEVLCDSLAGGLKFIGHFGETREPFVCFDDGQLVGLSLCHGVPASGRRQVALAIQLRSE
jgi:hypothetical protein